MKHVSLTAFMLLLVVNLMGQSASYNRIINGFQKSYVNEATGDLQKAIEALEGIYEKDSYETNLRLGWLLYSSGQYSESFKYYSLAIELRPFAIEPRFGVIYPLAAMGNWDPVIEQYEKIIEIAPGNTIAMHRLALVYYGREEYPKAEKLFDKVVNLYPFDYDALLMLGWTKLNLKKYREARVLFNKALMNTPGGQSAMEGLELLE